RARSVCRNHIGTIRLPGAGPYSAHQHEGVRMRPPIMRAQRSPVAGLLRLGAALVLLAFVIAACGGPGGSLLPKVEVFGITPARGSVAGGVSVTLTGRNFAQTAGAGGLSVLVCGAPLRDVRVVGEERQVLLPPAGRVS